MYVIIDQKMLNVSCSYLSKLYWFDTSIVKCQIIFLLIECLKLFQKA